MNNHRNKIVFAHANGFPPEAYIELHEAIDSSYHIESIEFLPLHYGSDPAEAATWHFFKEELIQFVEQKYDHPIIAMGHSLGAISILLAAVERPDLFQKIILLDPVLLTKNILKISPYIPLWLKKKYVPVSRIALNRKDVFDSAEEIFGYYRPKKVFRRLSDRTLRAYIQYGFVAVDGQLRLRYTKEWESHVYATIANSWPYLTKLQVPTLAIRGVASDVLGDESWDRWQSNAVATDFAEVAQAGHLVPLEQPLAVAADINQWL